MSKNKAPAEPSQKITAPVPVVPENQGCATSFLTQKKNEMDEACGEIKPKAPKVKGEYTQPDAEKEAGGEA